MIRKTTLILLLIISISSSASAATRYVSDDLFTYVHSGPGTKYKIIGSVNAGEPIKVLQTNRDAGYTEIKDPKGRIGWVNSKYISKQPGLQERLAKLEIKFTKLNTQLSTSKNNLKSHSNKANELKKANSALEKELKEVQALNDNLSEILDTKKNDLLLRWFSYGGMVGGIGLLLGLILPSLMPNRKKTRW